MKWVHIREYYVDIAKATSIKITRFSVEICFESPNSTFMVSRNPEHFDGNLETEICAIQRWLQQEMCSA